MTPVRSIHACGLALGLIVLPAGQALAGQALPPDHGALTYRAVRVDTPPVLDGDLSDAAWRGAAVISTLVQQVPTPGAPPSEKTEVRLVYDDAALYVAFDVHESDPALATRTMLRYRYDSIWRLDDVVRIAFDPFHEHRRGYVFSFNALGTKQDSQADNGVWQPTWDEVWDVRTRQSDTGWSAEARIPFRIIRFPEARQEHVWGLQIERLIKRRNEGLRWAPTPSTFPLTRLEYAGHLSGITRVQPRRNLQVVPYAAAGATRVLAGATDVTSDLGADAKVALGPASFLALSYNTNFAQVEVDDQQVNLTRFPLFFPEKREFFLESAQLFDVGLGQEVQMFFSRRIGLAGGRPVPLLGGARLTAKAGRFDVGLLTTQTKRETGQPSANLSTGRVRWNVGSRSYIGGIVTSSESEAIGSRTVAADGRVWLGRYFQVDGFVAGVQNRQGGHTPTAFTTAAVYDEDRWGLTLRTVRIDRDFDPALGFVRRRNFQRQDAALRRGWRLNDRWARKLDVTAELGYLTDLRGRLDTRDQTVSIADELPSGDVFRSVYTVSADRLDVTDDPFVLHPRRGIVVRPGEYTFGRWLVGYQGYDGRPFTVGAEIEGGAFYGGRRSAFRGSAAWRPSPHVVLTGDYQLNDVALPQGQFTTHLLRGRVSVPMTARAVVDAFLQWNGLTQELNTQVRLHIIYARDSNFYVVFTDQQFDEAGRRILQSRAIQTKLAYRWYW